MVIRQNISLFLICFLVSGFIFIGLTEKGYSGFPVIPGGPPCCDIQASSSCAGGENAAEICETSLFCQNPGNCQFIENGECVATGEFTGQCFANTSPPTIMPDVTSVPTVSGYGLLSLAVVLGLIGIGAFLARRKKTSA